jgi:hypothetical protein
MQALRKADQLDASNLAAPRGNGLHSWRRDLAAGSIGAAITTAVFMAIGGAFLLDEHNSAEESIQEARRIAEEKMAKMEVDANARARRWIDMFQSNFKKQFPDYEEFRKNLAKKGTQDLPVSTPAEPAP